MDDHTKKALATLKAVNPQALKSWTPTDIIVLIQAVAPLLIAILQWIEANPPTPKP